MDLLEGLEHRAPTWEEHLQYWKGAPMARGLPTRPDAEEYREFWKEVRGERSRQRALDLQRALFEKDFWAFLSWGSAMRELTWKSDTHPNRGLRVVDEPFIFFLARCFQGVVEQGRDRLPFWWHLARFHWKTTVLVNHGSTWETLRDPSVTHSIFVYKVKDVAASIFGGIKSQLENNKKLREIWPDVVPTPKEIRAQKLPWTKSHLTIKRPGGAREYSWAMWELEKGATSQHATVNWYDDPVERESSRSHEAAAARAKAIRDTIPTLGEGGRLRFVGTRWTSYDAWSQLQESGFFAGGIVSRHCWVSKDPKHWRKVAIFQDPTFIEAQQLAGQDTFPVQYEGDVPDAIGGYGNWGDARLYESAEQLAKDCNFYMVIDPAKGTRGGDHVAILVFGAHVGKVLVSFDLYLERLPVDRIAPLAWGIYDKWHCLDMFVENVGDGAYLAYLRDARQKGRHKAPKPLPDIKSAAAKKQRIEGFLRAVHRKEFWFPRTGYGHGSSDNPKDTLLQMVDEQFKPWTPSLKNQRNDALDVHGWACHPKLRSRIRYPDSRFASGGSGDEIFQDFYAMRKARTHNTSRPSGIPLI